MFELFFGFLGVIFLGLWIRDLWMGWKMHIRHAEVKFAYHKKYPILGNLFDFLRSTSYKSLALYPKVYGPFVQFSIVNVHALLVTDLAIAKEVLARRPKKIHRPSILHYANQVLHLETGLINTDGLMWSRIRKATAPSFSMLNLTNKLSLVIHEMIGWIERLHEQQHIPATVSKEKKPITYDMKYESFSLTIRTITAVAFGLGTNNPSDVTSQTYFFSNIFKQDVEKIFRFMRETAMFGFPHIVWNWVPYYYQFEKNGREANDRFTTACKIIIDRKRRFWEQYREAKKLSTAVEEEFTTLPTSMLDSLLQQEYCDEEAATSSSSISKLANEEELIANVKVFYLAGSDTTSVTITWLVYFCCQFPDYVQLVRQEAKAILFSDLLADIPLTSTSTSSLLQEMKKMLTSITIDRIKEMTFTMCLIKETLRLRAPVPALAVEVANRDDQGEAVTSITLSNGLTIPSGLTIWVNQDGLQQLPEVFEDPLKFNPHRWMKKSEEKEEDFAKRLQLMEAHFLPFGSGPRICPGMNLAIYEAVLAIAYLAFFFDMELACPVGEIERVPNVVAMASKMPVHLKPIYH